MHTGYCLLSFIFIGASLYTMITCSSCDPFKRFTSLLKKNQLEFYQLVVKQRLEKAIQGLILGTILALIYLFFFKHSVNIFTNSCIFSTIAFLTQYLYYILSPKLSMLPHLDNQKQIEAWYDVYKFMQMRYHFGMLLGIIGYILFVFSI